MSDRAGEGGGRHGGAGRGRAGDGRRRDSAPDPAATTGGGRHRAGRRPRPGSGDGRHTAGLPATARGVALDVLRAVRDDDAYANLLLPARIRRARLSAADAALATELAYGTLRLRGRYDPIIAVAASRDATAIDPDVLDVLRLGAHQLLGMRIPAHAAVDESVDLARRAGAARASGFVNAVLRSVAGAELDTWLDRALDRVGDPDERLAIRWSHPTWVVRALRSGLAADGTAAERLEGELEALLEADVTAPRVALTALPGLAEPPAGPDASHYAPTAFTAPSGDPTPLVASGAVRVQDEGSQLAALALSRARPVRPGERWLDLCAGPGGKAALLAAEARLGGAVLEANELAPARAELVRQALAPVDPTVEVQVGDGREVGALHAGRYDRILLDAPCTGLGALRRRPEARWRKQPGDVPELTALQTSLLDAALDALAPGGVLAYVTCSPHPAETRAVVADAVRRGRARRLDTPAVLDAITRRPLGLTGDDGAAQLWPHRHGTDAMFIQLLAHP